MAKWEWKIVPEYSRELADEMLAEVEAGRTDRDICHSRGFRRTTFHRWIRDNVDGIAARYSAANEIRTRVMVEDMILAADGKSIDGEDDPAEDSAVKVMRDRLKSETRRWIISRTLRKEYGDKVDVTQHHDGPVDIRFEVVSPPAVLPAGGGPTLELTEGSEGEHADR